MRLNVEFRLDNNGQFVRRFDGNDDEQRYAALHYRGGDKVFGSQYNRAETSDISLANSIAAVCAAMQLCDENNFVLHFYLNGGVMFVMNIVV